MKKSEMIQIMVNKLERCHDRHGSLWDFEFAVKEILEDMEEAGMLPPFYIPKETDEENLIMGWEGINEWEEETKSKVPKDWKYEGSSI